MLLFSHGVGQGVKLKNIGIYGREEGPWLSQVERPAHNR